MKIKLFTFSLLSSMMVSYSALAKTPANISEHMNDNQIFYLNPNKTVLSGMFWSGKNYFSFFVTPIKYEGNAVLVRIDRIIRLWFADEKGYFSLRETNCKGFPCYDEKGKPFQAPAPLKSNASVGDTVWIDNDKYLIPKSTLKSTESNLISIDDYTCMACDWGF